MDRKLWERFAKPDFCYFCSEPLKSWRPYVCEECRVELNIKRDRFY